MYYIRVLLITVVQAVHKGVHMFNIELNHLSTFKVQNYNDNAIHLDFNGISFLD